MGFIIRPCDDLCPRTAAIGRFYQHGRSWLLSHRFRQRNVERLCRNIMSIEAFITRRTNRTGVSSGATNKRQKDTFTWKIAVRHCGRNGKEQCIALSYFRLDQKWRAIRELDQRNSNTACKIVRLEYFRRLNASKTTVRGSLLEHSRKERMGKF